MRARFWFIFSLSFGLSAAFGCDDEDKPPRPPTVGDFEIVELVDEVDDTVPIATPLVEILSPLQAVGLSAAELITTPLCRVECLVNEGPNGRRVDKTSITITLVKPDGQELTQPGQPGLAANRYVADFNLEDQVNGAVTVTCSAKDMGTPALEGLATVETFLDLGPSILVLSPQNDFSYARQLNVTFRVDPNPVTDVDPASAIALEGISVKVATVPLPGVKLDTNGNYSVNFQFDDPNLFATPLDGASSVLIEVTNQRGVSRRQNVVFKADSSGALITFITPLAGELIGGIFTVRVKIEDPAGVDPNSVVATIARDYRFTLRQTGTGEFEGAYDGRNLNPQIVYPLLTVTCKDNVGNENSYGQIVALDTRRPIIDLDPPPMREIDSKEGYCSELFDPVGKEAPNDGERIQQLSLIRVRIEDRANGEEASGDSFVVPMAGINEAKVQLFVLDDQNGALLVDTDGDGICDEINPLLKPSSVPTGPNEAAVVDLVPVSPKGSSYMPGAMGGIPFGDDRLTWIDDDGCRHGTTNEPPEPVCRWSTSASRVISDVVSADPVIFAIPPVSSDNCMGVGFDAIGANIKDGWTCVAVRAEDRLGNASISPPLRLCVDANPNDGDNGCVCKDVDSLSPDTTDYGDCSTQSCPYLEENGAWVPLACWQPEGRCRRWQHPDFAPQSIDFGCRNNPPVPLPDCTGVYDAGSNSIIPGSSCQHPLNFRTPTATWRNLRRK